MSFEDQIMEKQESKFTFRPKINVSKEVFRGLVNEQLERTDANTPILTPGFGLPLMQRERSLTSKTIKQD